MGRNEDAWASLGDIHVARLEELTIIIKVANERGDWAVVLDTITQIETCMTHLMVQTKDRQYDDSDIRYKKTYGSSPIK